MNFADLFPTTVAWSTATAFELHTLAQEFEANLERIHTACDTVEATDYAQPRVTSEFRTQDILTHLELAHCESMIDRAVKQYHPHAKRAKSWIGILHTGMGHPPHSHAPAICSGTLYLSTSTQGGELEFHTPNPYTRAGYFPYNQTRVQRKPQMGDIGVWPGWLEHSVTPNTSKQSRYAISFDYKA